ncbi:hypothetical protein C8J57DRAFT_1536889 [Mycena rebaudengoi]|nr:hypothetical protein C8J57DRAFT_1536889 [Mycena rebaudengoi]
MTSVQMNSEPQNPAEAASAAGTEFFSAPHQPGPSPVALMLRAIATSPSPSPRPVPPPFTLHRDEDRSPFLVDAAGARLEVSVEPQRGSSSLSGGPSGIPMHPARLFDRPHDVDSSSSVESTLSESQQLAADGLPELALDINPDTLTSHQIDQLNTIRGIIGTATVRLLATTVIVADQQLATEQMHDTIQELKVEFVGRIESMCDEVNSQRSRLNRCLDDNLRLVRETGASVVQMGEVLSTLSRNGGAHRCPHEADPVVIDRNPLPLRIPEDVKAAAAVIIAPHQTNESAEAFDRRSQATLHTKDKAHVAFTDGVSSVTGDALRDVAADFAAEMENVIRETIEYCVGRRVDLPQGVHAPKVDNPLRYRGADDHDAFMMFLERLLGWMKANNCGGADLNEYRITLLQNYLDEEALKWFVHEVDNPRKNGGGHVGIHRHTTRDFENIKWSLEDGPEGLYTDLTQAGDRMIETPSQFTLRDQFMKALPSWMKTELKMHCGMTAEFGDLETLCMHTRQVWEIDISIRAKREAEQAAVQAVTRTHPPPRGHYAWDKECPNYSEHAPPCARIAAQRVLESYSDEEDEYLEDNQRYDYQEPTEPLDEDDWDPDPHTAPDLGDLLATAEEPRLNAMHRHCAQYYSMHIIDDMDMSMDAGPNNTETSVTDGTAEGPASSAPPTPPPFGTYNLGPICVVCAGCTLIIRQLIASPENGLEVDRKYSVCAHLAHPGVDPLHIELPESPTLVTRITEWDDELDLPPGVLIPFDQGFTEEMAEEEVQLCD